MIDRGIIKWQPFNSGFNTKDVIKDIEKKKEKERVKFPTLSEDQLLTLENLVKKAYHLKLKINIYYYYDGEIKNLNGQINYFDSFNKKIYINNKAIYFSQIIEVKEN